MRIPKSRPASRGKWKTLAPVARDFSWKCRPAARENFLKKHPFEPIICTTFKWGFSLPGPEVYTDIFLADIGSNSGISKKNHDRWPLFPINHFVKSYVKTGPFKSILGSDIQADLPIYPDTLNFLPADHMYHLHIGSLTDAPLETRSISLTWSVIHSVFYIKNRSIN